MNFPKILITIFAALIVIVACLIVGTTYGTRLAVNNRVKETTTERTCRTTSIKPYESFSYAKRNDIIEEEIEETCTKKELETSTIKNRTAALTGKDTSIKKPTTFVRMTSIVTTTVVSETSTTEYTTVPISAATTVEEEEQDESSVLFLWAAALQSRQFILEKGWRHE